MSEIRKLGLTNKNAVTIAVVLLGGIVIAASLVFIFIGVNQTADAQSCSGFPGDYPTCIPPEDTCGSWLYQTKYFDVQHDYCTAVEYRCPDPITGEPITCRRQDCNKRRVTEGYECRASYQWRNHPLGGDAACVTDDIIKTETCTAASAIDYCPRTQTTIFRICYSSSSGGGGGNGGGDPDPSCVNYSTYPTLDRYPQYNPNRSAVTTMQKGLIELGYSLPKFGADGYYGAETSSAVSRFKSNNGLGSNGDVFENSAWQVMDDRLNEARGQSSCNPEPTTYRLRMRSSIYLPDGTSQSIQGVAQQTCLGNGTTNFSKETTTKPGECSISTPTTITFSGNQYNFVEWYFDGTLQRTGASRTITINDTNPDRIARAYYRASSPICGDGFVQSPETCDDGNKINGDGCSSTCQTEAPPPPPPPAGPTCGNNIREAGEECDGKDTPINRVCSGSCTLIPECSDGIDNDGDGLIDQNDPSCHTDGDGGNPGTYDPGDNTEGNDTPSVWITVTPPVVGRGGSATAEWGINNPDDFDLDSCVASSNPNDTDWQGSVSDSGSKSVTPDNFGVVTYTFTCTNTEGASGSDSATVLVPFIKEVLP